MTLNAPIHLLAKSSSTPEEPDYHESYTGHIIDTVKTASSLADKRGETFLESMGLGKKWLKPLRQATIRGAYIHDIGKANHQFQRLVAGRSRLPQALRHECISLLLALEWKPLLGFRDKENNGEEVVYASLFAASGHHLKFADLEMSPREGSDDGRLILYTGHRDVKELLEQGRNLFGLPTSPSDTADLRVDLSGDPMKEVREWVRESMLWWENRDGEVKRFVALVKALVIAADLISSAAVRHRDMQTWADSVLDRVCERDELREIAQRALEGCSIRAFQDRVAHASSRVTFVHAGCGTGKTIAAYLWAANRASNRKVFFCYPTTGTATQGYSDYTFDIGLRSRLIHSRSEADLEMLRESRGDEVDPLDSALRYERLSTWDVPLVVATADTVLGLIQNNRRGLFSFPAIGVGAFVFDEIHSYDERLFGALLRFLDAFLGARMLLMTASLQRERFRRIEEVLARRGERLEVIGGPEELEGAKRYLINPVAKDAPWEEAGKVLQDGGKVLWVVNTVDRAREFWKEAGERLGTKARLLYHSRYRYVDRVNHHRDVIDAFRKPGAVLAVTTQVCEVSLDISADMLVTDLAPVPALIQRMGRVNRRSVSGPPKPVHVVDVGSPEPYTEAEIVVARRWVDELIKETGQSVSQADLAEKFKLYGSEDNLGQFDSSWIDGGPFSTPEHLREAGYTFSVIRGEDRERCVSTGGRVANKEVMKYSVPMPLWPVVNEIRGWVRLNGTFVAPKGRIDYSMEEGGSWR